MPTAPSPIGDPSVDGQPSRAGDASATVRAVLAGDRSQARPALASFHLVRHLPGRQVVALADLGLDRWRLARTDGLLFWRLLGTGRGRSTGPGADLRRTALFAVWRDPTALNRFEAHMAPRWSRAEESYHLRLAGVGGHGSWRGFDVLGAIAPAVAEGPIAVLTRAEVRWRHQRAFGAAARRVSEELSNAPGLLRVCGIGEAPLGRQGTFSLWRDVEAMTTFARTFAEHGDAVTRTRRDGWYSEELFARFRPLDAHGTWDGGDPLSRSPLG